METDFYISKEKKCPECGGDIKVYDTLMFLIAWECVNPKCNYEDSDW
jgi:hypothetical protein